MILTAVLRLRIDDVAEVAVVGDTASDLQAGSQGRRLDGRGGSERGSHEGRARRLSPHTHLIDSVADLPALLDG